MPTFVKLLGIIVREYGLGPGFGKAHEHCNTSFGMFSYVEKVFCVLRNLNFYEILRSNQASSHQEAWMGPSKAAIIPDQCHHQQEGGEIRRETVTGKKGQCGPQSVSSEEVAAGVAQFVQQTPER